MTRKQKLRARIEELDDQRRSALIYYNAIRSGATLGDPGPARGDYRDFVAKLKEARHDLKMATASEPQRLKKPGEFKWVDDRKIMGVRVGRCGCSYWCPFCGSETLGSPPRHRDGCRRGEIDE